mmetsp:Transcript_8481/g.26282  ORF Transcript_8481/g.26282 Transcript_8481/m.26282 type:complete len:278 (+) Transcript_8481:297-1130(+)
MQTHAALLLDKVIQRETSRSLTETLEIGAAKADGALGEASEVDRRVQRLVVQHGVEDLAALLDVRHTDHDPLGEAPQNGRIHLGRAVGGADHHHLRLIVAGDTVPQSHELSLDAQRELGLVVGALLEEHVQLVYEDDGRRQLARQREDGRGELFRLTHPLAEQAGDAQVDEDGVGLPSDRLGQHGLAGARRTVEEDARRPGEQPRACRREELRPTEGQHHMGVDELLFLVQAADLVKVHLDLMRKHHVVPHQRLGAIQLWNLTLYVIRIHQNLFQFV